MNSTDQILCPIPDMGFCIYERCSFWDAARQVCDADCVQSRMASETETPEDCCTIYWTEDFD